MSKDKCLYNCGSPVESNPDEYHVYPYSASEIEVKLPSGIVCNSCNRYFGNKLENHFCQHHPGVGHKVLAVKRTKKGKPPMQLLTHGILTGTDSGNGFRNISFPPKDLNFKFDEGKSFAIKSNYENRPFNSRTISRTLAKMALELQCLPKDNPFDPYDPMFDSYKEYIRYNRGDYIWFAYLAEGIPSQQSYPKPWTVQVSDEIVCRGVFLHFPGVVYLVPLPPILPISNIHISLKGKDMFICDEDLIYSGHTNKLSLVFTKPKDE